MKKFLFILSFMAIGFVAEAKNGVVIIEKTNATPKTAVTISTKKVSLVDECSVSYSCQDSHGNVHSGTVTAANCDAAYDKAIVVMSLMSII